MCVLPVPGGPCSRTPRLRCCPLARSAVACRPIPTTCRSMPSSRSRGSTTSARPIRGRARKAGRLPGRRAVLRVERDDLTPVDVMVGGQPPYLIEQLPGPGLAGRGHLKPDRFVRAAVLGAAEQQGETLAALFDQVDAAADAGMGDPARPGRTRLGGHAAHPGRAEQRVGRAVAEQVGQPGLPVPGPGDAEQFVGPPRAGQPGLDAQLDVHLVERRPGCSQHRPRGGLRAELG